MNRKHKLIMGGAAAAVIIAGGASAAIAGGSDDDHTDKAITGAALTKASEAALAKTGSGKVTETEVNDEESKYEVEVTLPDGSQVDVQLDENFKVVGTKHDSEHAK